MIATLRKAYNDSFVTAKYQQLLQEIEYTYGHRPPFRIAETPVFVGKEMRDMLFDACEQIIDVIVQPNFKELSSGALLSGQIVPNETDHTTFLQMDFGICMDENGNLTPQLIEVQGFPSLYFYQYIIADLYRKYFSIPEDISPLFGGMDRDRYLELLRKIIVGDYPPENAIILETEPDQQATLIDFIVGKHLLGIPYKCVTDLICEGREVYYKENGRKIKVHRIFNRVIFDELIRRDDLKREFLFTEEHDVEWIGHPNWFFRISKHTLPLLGHIPYVPNSFFLSDIDHIPEDLHNYVLKPLYSFSGTGVIINLNRYDFDSIKDPENYILQRKVTYAPVVETPNVPAKCEIRMLTIWERGKARPIMVNNLARLSKGEMIGVKYNKDKDWVGGSVGFFEQ
ncbi:MAG: hypothetical protein AAGI49_05655 [Bacteroidota bacterium]